MKTGSCAVLWKDDKMLLGRRSPDRRFYPNVWDLIGGHCEDQEAPEQTLVRELREELGVTPIEFREIAVLNEPDEASRGAYRYHVYLVTEWSGQLANRQPEEHVALEWFTISEAATLDLAHPDYPTLFREIAERG